MVEHGINPRRNQFSMADRIEQVLFRPEHIHSLAAGSPRALHDLSEVLSQTPPEEAFKLASKLMEKIRLPQAQKDKARMAAYINTLNLIHVPVKNERIDKGMDHLKGEFQMLPQDIQKKIHFFTSSRFQPEGESVNTPDLEMIDPYDHFWEFVFQSFGHPDGAGGIWPATQKGISKLLTKSPQYVHNQLRMGRLLQDQEVEDLASRLPEEKAAELRVRYQYAKEVRVQRIAIKKHGKNR